MIYARIFCENFESQLSENMRIFNSLHASGRLAGKSCKIEHLRQYKEVARPVKPLEQEENFIAYDKKQLKR